MDNVGIVMGECLPACPSLQLLREEGLELPCLLPAGYLLCCIDDPPTHPPSPILLPHSAMCAVVKRHIGNVSSGASPHSAGATSQAVACRRGRRRRGARKVSNVVCSIPGNQNCVVC